MHALSLTTRRLTLAVVIAALLLVFGVQRASASPGTVSLQAGTCYGAGVSAVVSGAGGSGTEACVSGSRYLSASVGFADGYVNTLAGNWYSYDKTHVFTSTGPHGNVTVSAATHNLAFVGILNGYESTNTW